MFTRLIGPFAAVLLSLIAISPTGAQPNKPGQASAPHPAAPAPAAAPHAVPAAPRVASPPAAALFGAAVRGTIGDAMCTCRAAWT